MLPYRILPLTSSSNTRGRTYRDELNSTILPRRILTLSSHLVSQTGDCICLASHFVSQQSNKVCAQDQEIYECKADGLHDLLITDKLVQFPSPRPTMETFLLVHLWNRYLFELPTMRSPLAWQSHLTLLMTFRARNVIGLRPGFHYRIRLAGSTGVSWFGTERSSLAIDDSTFWRVSAAENTRLLR